MKLACASGSLHREIERGELTQLEFIDVCARDLACDGVVLDLRHFPRTDDDYLAQVKKMAVDRGLSIAALSDGRFFASARDWMARVLGYAVTLGAPLVAAPLAREINESWNDQLAQLSEATSLAKALNVTLAVRNAPETFAASAHDFKRVSKEADSAWLRFGPEPQRLDAASDPRALGVNTVLLWSDAGLQTDRSVAATIAAFAGFRGHLVIDDAAESASPAALAAALDRWRAALAAA
ncbi:MAG: TIM barrel protein [Candidatus Cybelea sp.]